MYDASYLGARLRAASSGREDQLFATQPMGGGDIRYGDFFAGAEQVARALVALGVAPGDRVAAQVEKSVEALQLYIGTVLAGGVFLPLNTAYTAAEIAYFLGDAEPRVFVCDPRKHDALKAVAEKSGAPALLTLGGDGNGSFADRFRAETPGFDAIARNADDLAAILYTSGTTGRSKGAMLSHRALASNAETLKDIWRFTRDDRLIHALPIFHTHGLFVASNVCLMAGASLIFIPKFDVDTIIAAMPSATTMMGVPTFYVRLLGDARLNPALTQTMRLFVSGSAPLLAETHTLWRERTGHAILERYGMTETNMNTSNPYDGDRRAGTVGFPLPGVEVQVADPQSGGILPTGSVGVLEVRGPNVFSGYWRMPEKTKEELKEDGFFITGDLGKIDEEGYVTIVGREKDLIITGGYNVYPKELEMMIDDQDGVLESAVIGVPHPDFGEGVVAIVVPKPGATVSVETIASNISNDLAKYKQPKKIFVADELQRNSMGKVQKNVLRETYKNTFQ